MKKIYSEKTKNVLLANCWEQLDAGGGRASDFNKRVAVFARKRNLGEIGFTSPDGKSENPSVPTVSAASHKTTMEDILKCGKSEDIEDINDISISESESCFFNSLKQKNDSLVIRCDCFYIGNPSKPLSYSLSCVDEDTLIDIMFFPLSVSEKLCLSYMLGRTLDYLNVHRYRRERYTQYECIVGFNSKGKAILERFNTKSEAEDNAKFYFMKSGKVTKTSVDSIFDITDDRSKINVGKYNYMRSKPVVVTDDIDCHNITVLLNKGTRFIAALDSDNISDYILNSDNYYVRDVDNGLFSYRSYNCSVNSCIDNGHKYIYPISLNVRDVLNHSCDGMKSIFDYSSIVNYPTLDFFKLKVFHSIQESMDNFLADHPYEYIVYACECNNSTLLYIFQTYGINKLIPCTLLSETAKIAKSFICEERGWDDKDFMFNFNGMKKVKDASCAKAKNKHAYATNEIKDINHMFSDAYSGGVNLCSKVVNHSNTLTYDIDANNGYPTVMGSLPMIDWNHPVYKIMNNCDLTLEDFGYPLNDREPDNLTIYPFIPMVVKATFEFDNNTVFPNLGVRVNTKDEDITIYQLINKDDDYSYTAIELYLALKMGAKVHIKSGYILQSLYDEETGNIIYGFRSMMTTLIKERNKMIDKYGKNSIQSQILKLLVNSLYGKTAQGVKDISKDKKTDKQGVLTNPVIAAMTTAGMRSLVFAAMNEINAHGYEVYSVTTDGFITNCPIDVLNSYDLFGLKHWFLESRKALTGDKDAAIWSLKHQQEDLYNFTTRGNISLNVGDKGKDDLPGVAAFNSLSRPYPELPKEDYANRFDFRKLVETRTGKLADQTKKYPKIEDIGKGILYIPSIINESKSMDFDLKRKPVKESLTKAYAEYDGVTYEIAQFDTVPYQNTEEMLMYRKVGRSSKCLRTVEEWNLFFKNIDSCIKKSLGYDEFDIIYNIVHNHKTHSIIIPFLADKDISVDDKIKWINEHNNSDKTFTKSHWNHASDPIPAKKKIPMVILEDKIAELCE